MEVYDFWIIALLLGLASYFILRMALNSATTGKQAKTAKPTGTPAQQQGKSQAPAKAAPAAAKPSKDAPKKKADAADTTKKPAGKTAVAKKEVVAAAQPAEEEEVLDTTPLTGDPAEIERLVSTHSLGSPDMDVDFKMVSPILLGQHKQRKQKKSQEAGHFPADQDSDGEGQQEAEKAKAAPSKTKFSEKEAEKLRKQGFKVAGGSRGSPNGALGEGGNRDEGPDPAKEFTGISCYAPGWEKKIEPKVDDAGRGVQVTAESKPKKMKRLPMPAVKPEEFKETSAQPAEKAPAATASHVDPVADQFPPQKGDDDDDDEDDEVVLPDFALRHAVDKRSSQPTVAGRGRGRGGARGGRGGNATTSTKAETTGKPLNPAAPTFVPSPTMPMPFGMPMGMPMPFLRPGFPMGVPFVPPPPPPPYTGGVKVGDNAKKGKGEKSSDAKGSSAAAPAGKGGKSVPLPRSKQTKGDAPAGGEVKPAEAPTISVRVGGKPAPTATKDSTSKSASDTKKPAEKKGKDAAEKGSRQPKKVKEEEGEGKKEGADSAADTSALRTKPCRFFASPEGCRYGADCKFIHEAKAAE